MKTFHKGTTFDTSNLQPEELIHMDFALYNVTYLCGITSMISVVCAKTIMLWVFPNVSKQYPVRVVRFILTTLDNEQHPCKHVIVDEDGNLVKSTDFTNLLVDEFKISIKTAGSDA